MPHEFLRSIRSLLETLRTCRACSPNKHIQIENLTENPNTYDLSIGRDLPEFQGTFRGPTFSRDKARISFDMCTSFKGCLCVYFAEFIFRAASPLFDGNGDPHP